MKHSILLAFFTIFTFYFVGCFYGIETQKSMEVNGYDFTKYSKIGFLFTPEKYLGNYESVGLIEVKLYPEVKAEKTYDEHKHKFDYWKVEKILPSEVIDSIYVVCKNMGANALMNFKIDKTDLVSNGAIYYYGIKVSGFGIKRQ